MDCHLLSNFVPETYKVPPALYPQLASKGDGLLAPLDP